MIGAVSFLLVCYLVYSTYKIIISTNKNLTLFLESIQHQDFSVNFKTNNNLDNSFSDLNASFNSVLNAFRKERSEKLEHSQFLNTIVNHVNTGVIAYRPDGKIDLMNKSSKVLLGEYHLKNINELKNKLLLARILELPSGQSAVIIVSSTVQLAVYTTTLKLVDKVLKLVVIQNIYKELLNKQVESWQKLASVLKHEIMNSLTPITSINSTLGDIIKEDFYWNASSGRFEISKESLDDLNDGFSTIRMRTKGLIKFINAYRDYTSLPKPNFVKIELVTLLNRVKGLMKAQFLDGHIAYSFVLPDKGNSKIMGDINLLEMVLINLIKNAIQAVNKTENPSIGVALICEENASIRITDNGSGIEPEAIEKIFIPFYTTKEDGSGLGLSLSREIIQLHNGTLTVTSVPHSKTIFTIQFYRN
ncbi:sensor histidine kinase [Aquimarina intermedia]|nr:ATP-binding protein [Aquimarina intermedia]